MLAVRLAVNYIVQFSWRIGGVIRILLAIRWQKELHHIRRTEKFFSQPSVCYSLLRLRVAKVDQMIHGTPKREQWADREVNASVYDEV